MDQKQLVRKIWRFRAVRVGVGVAAVAAVAVSLTSDDTLEYMSTLKNLAVMPEKPGLPIFGTVSAATASVVPVPGGAIVPSTRVGQIMKYGFPGTANVRIRENYVLSFDRRLRIANWVFEHFNKNSLKKGDGVDREHCKFFEDETEHLFFRPSNEDYSGSGFDRGHLAAAGNHRHDQKCMQDTFSLLNIAPQVGKGFNRDSWNRLERYVRHLASTYKEIYACTGPLFLPRREDDGKLYVKYRVIGKNHVAVPTHFFKIVVGETDDGTLDMEVYVMPNQVLDDSTPLSAYYSSPEAVERASGLLFFSNVSREKLRAVNRAPTSKR